MNQLVKTLQRLLEAKHTGLSEYELLKQLISEQHPLFISANLSDVLSLFRSHFVLFHALYLLRDNLRSAGQLDLKISPLHICLQPITTRSSTQSQMPNLSDPLRAYYLDLDNLSATDREAVEQLLNSSLASLQPSQQLSDALAELGIEQPLHTLNSEDLRSHYRKLVSRHHPDRGGCTERLQRINQAMDMVRAYQVSRSCK
ncbi:molecular chaperone DnaJ [Pseudomonas sp. C27(2019)]|nr:molecular chaperone DnaJ [Pseudomonas sp. C27(2019)]